MIPLRPKAKERLGYAADELIPWRYHVTTLFVDQFLVDALTGHLGHHFDSYLESYFDHHEYFRLAEYDVTTEGEPA